MLPRDGRLLQIAVTLCLQEFYNYNMKASARDNSWKGCSERGRKWLQVGLVCSMFIQYFLEGYACATYSVSENNCNVLNDVQLMGTNC